MSNELIPIPWEQLKAELSFCGNPDLIITIGKEIEASILGRINVCNIPDLLNIQYMLEKILIDVKLLEEKERLHQHP